jgi:hypothetical protein
MTIIETIQTRKSCAPNGISTAELKEKTGLAERQIWNIINRATKLGKIRTVQRGLYGGIVEAQEQKTI